MFKLPLSSIKCDTTCCLVKIVHFCMPGHKVGKENNKLCYEAAFFLASQISLDTKPIRITTLWVSDSSLIMKRSSSLPPTITEQGNKTKNKTKKKF